MTLDEMKHTYPLGARLWASSLATWVDVKGYWTTSRGDNWIEVKRLDNNTMWYVPHYKLYADEHGTPVPVWCGSGGGVHEHVHKAEASGDTTPVDDEPVPHVPGISHEEIDHDAWKSFKDLL